jgi:bifunctional DNA-binding transcriptional regulator/antitoxin component of YhaV-PrlF toxin-antitoxin module
MTTGYSLGMQRYSIMHVKQLSQRRAIILPPEICEVAGIQPGDFLEMDVIDGNVVMTPKKLVDARVSREDSEVSS